MHKPDHFFEFAAQVGLTKHLGEIEATKELMDLCRVDRDHHVLDVGCGVGVTPCFIARRYHCRVTGVDILEKMVDRSRDRARGEGLTDQVSFRVADAEELPFDDETFDAVITESVLSLLHDKSRAIRELARVTRTGGYVGLNEPSWLKVPPPEEIRSWASRQLGTEVEIPSPNGWVSLLENAGLPLPAEYQTRGIQVKNELRGLKQRYGGRELTKVAVRMLLLCLKSSRYRRFVKKARRGKWIPDGLEEFFGYGLYAVRKGRRAPSTGRKRQG